MLPDLSILASGGSRVDGASEGPAAHFLLWPQWLPGCRSCLHACSQQARHYLAAKPQRSFLTAFQLCQVGCWTLVSRGPFLCLVSLLKCHLCGFCFFNLKLMRKNCRAILTFMWVRNKCSPEPDFKNLRIRKTEKRRQVGEQETHEPLSLSLSHTHTQTHTAEEREKRAEKETELERKASLDSERQAVAVYQGHF